MANDLLLNENSVLSDVKAPTINGIASRRVLSNQVLKNIYQGIIENDGRGITQKFSNDTSGAEIRITLQVPLNIEPRLLGGAINGGNFPTSRQEGKLDSVGVPVLYAIDDPVEIAQVSMDMIPIDLLSLKLKSLTDQINLHTNALTIAGKFYATYKRKIDGVEVNEIVTDETDLVNDFILGNSLLDEGAENVGVAMFPSEDRIAVIRNAYRPILLRKGVLTIGGANYGYDIQAKGTLSANARPTKLENGYIGDIDGVPFHTANNQIWKKAGQWLGLGDNEFADVVGYISSGLGNVRAIATAQNVVEVAPHPFGRGVLLKPLYRTGFKVVEGYEKGNVFIVKNTFKNPYAELLKQGLTTNDLKFVPRGSRINNALVVTTSGAKVTATYTTGLTKKVIGAKGDCKGSVSKFLALANPVQLNNGSATTITGAVANDVVSILSIANDGTCELRTLQVKA